ncbi:MAG TPA: IS5 family transposase [Candidatus Sulfopaludibacter sp.]|nr:IS5 family transposase [Candidatus Sulfopaludibacter sp.]
MKWSAYNQSLVRRGEILIGFDVINNWDTELKEMNKDKVGEPFSYPDTFLLLLGYAKVYFHLPYRQTEGIAQGHAKGKVPSIPHYTTINRRINKLDIKIKDNTSKEFEDDYFIIAIDSTGIKVTNRGQWIRDKWGIRKGYLKIHIAVDIKSKKILSMKVTDEHVHDSKMLPELVQNIIKSNSATASKLFADGAYDSNEIFRCLADNGILPCIKLRKNAKVRWKKGNTLRNLSVISQKKDLQRWKDSVSYGQRWIAETVFSCIKRRFGEYVYSVKLKHTIQEMMLKASLYNKMISV